MTEMVRLSKSSSPTESQLCLAFPASHVPCLDLELNQNLYGLSNRMWRLQELGKITAAVLMGKIEAVLSVFESKCGHIARSKWKKFSLVEVMYACVLDYYSYHILYH